MEIWWAELWLLSDVSWAAASGERARETQRSVTWRCAGRENQWIWKEESKLGSEMTKRPEEQASFEARMGVLPWFPIDKELGLDTIVPCGSIVNVYDVADCLDSYR